MTTRFTKFLLSGASPAILLVLGTVSAVAQSTATLEVEEVVVTGSKIATFGGIVSQQDAPKTREIIDQAYISSQPAGANALSDLNLVPGVVFTQEDPYGESGSGGHFSIHGIKGAQIAELVDGVPLNDGGNYAIYPGELLDPEVIANVNLITGSSDVDSPSSSSLGGAVNINSMKPTDDMNAYINTSYGSFSYWRTAAMINTGEFGPWGTKAWIEGSDQQYDKYTGVGHDRKWQVNAKVYQDLGGGDFIAVAGFYDQQVADFYFGDDFASYTTSGANKNPVIGYGYTYHGLLATAWNGDYNNTYTPPSSAAANANYIGIERNPTYTGNLRGESRFTLLDNLHLTVDPSYQWVLANGGGSTTVAGTDKRLTGLNLTSSASNLTACTAGGIVTGLDLDGAVTAAGAPVCSDTVRVYGPSNTQTNRITLNTSLIWDITDTDILQFAYAYDHAKPRQTGEYQLLQANGSPSSLFAGLAGYGTPIIAADGTVFQKRNRFTIADLNQGSVEYIGRFFDDTLRVDVGLRDPFFSRNLNQYCYTQPATAVTSSTTNVYCTQSTAIASSAGYTVAPFHLQTSYNKALPNLGVTYKLDDVNQLFADYTSALNAPVNDDLYALPALGAGVTATSVTANSVKPETSSTTEVGYRYQTPVINATVDAYYTLDRNHIVASFNQATNDTVDTNEGSVYYYGWEGVIGATPIENLTFIQSINYNHATLGQNLPYNATTVIPTKGKTPPETPLWSLGSRIQYKFDMMTFGVQWKFVDKRFVTLVDDLSVPDYTTVDADFRLALDKAEPGMYLQFNVINVFSENYIGSFGNVPTTNNSALPYYSEGYGYQGAPRTFQVELHIPAPI